MKIPLLTKRCPECGDVTTLRVEREDLLRWRQGTLIQNAFPYLSADERERLMTGICPPCWKRIFAERPEDSEEEWTPEGTE